SYGHEIRARERSTGLYSTRSGDNLDEGSIPRGTDYLALPRSLRTYPMAGQYNSSRRPISIWTYRSIHGEPERGTLACSYTYYSLPLYYEGPLVGYGRRRRCGDRVRRCGLGFADGQAFDFGIYLSY